MKTPTMTRLLSVAVAFAVVGAALAPARAADDSKVKAATEQVDRGAKKIGEGKIGEGAGELATGVGKTVVEGAKFSGEKVKEAGKAAEKPAKSSWENLRDGTVAFGRSVRDFFANLFSN